MKKYILLLLILLNYSCKKDLTGHWHIKESNKNSFVSSLDIYENNDCYIYFSLSSKPIKGKHLPHKNSIVIPGDCGVFMFEYELKNNIIHLTNALGAKSIAEKQLEVCDRFKDFKTILDIDYLRIEKYNSIYKPKNSIENEFISEYINIDYSNKLNSLRLEYFEKINSIREIDTIIKNIEENYSESEIPYINYILTPDKNLKVKDLKLIIDVLNKNNQKNIFIQTLKPKPVGLNIFEYINSESIDFNSGIYLKDIIN